VRFPYGQAQATLHSVVVRGGQGRVATELLLDWPDSSLYCEVHTRACEWRLQAQSGANVIELGDPDFDPDHVVFTTLPDQARKLLNGGVRWELMRLQHALDVPGAFCRWRHGSLAIRVPVPLRRYDWLEEFILVALELYDQALLTQAHGIAFLDDHQAHVLRDAVCLVCGETIELDMVFCRRCKTPHHRECWQYTGGCTTYGCQERQYVVPAVARHNHDRTRGNRQPR
jgi:sarcosine oxidase delta subunit